MRFHPGTNRPLSFCVLGVLVSLCFAPPVHAEDAAARKPNIVFILADDLGYGDIGSYGQKQIKTPCLDRLASEGTRFTACYAGSTVCAPSRCALMTGLHMGHAHVRGNASVPLRPEDATVAEVLKGAGYATALIGKWGLGEAGSTGVPPKKGFDSFFGYLNQGHAHNYYPDFLWRNEEKTPLEGNTGGKRTTYSHDLFAKEALEFVEKQHKDRPFFLYLAFTIPHANNERGRAEGNGMEVPSDEPYAKENWPQVEKNRAAMVTRLDADVGRLLAKLKDLGLERDTLVFFTSDNGPHSEGGSSGKYFHSSGPFRGIKRDLYDGGIRVPMIVRRPGTVPAGRESAQAWAFWDVLPTLADVAGAKAPAGLDGISMLPTILGRETEQKPHPPLYWEFHEGGFSQAVRLGKWKGVRTGAGEPLEIYDLDADPGERNDVAAGHPDIAEKIEAILKSARTDSKEFPVKPGKRNAAKEKS